MTQIDFRCVFRGRKAQIGMRIGSISAVALICVSVLSFALRADEANKGFRPDLPPEWLQRIEDDRPLADSKDNAEEHKAFDRFVAFARKQPLEQLAQNVNKEVDTLKLMSSERTRFRSDVMHLEGRLLRLVKVAVDAKLQKEGITELYEGWVREEGNINPIGVIVSELPAGLKPGDKLSRFVAVDGYFFKLYRYTDPEGNERRAPLLIGRTFSKNEPAPEEVEEARRPGEPTGKMDCPVDWLEHVEDDHPIMTLKSNADEYYAYNYFVDFARKQPMDVLAKNARKQLTFARLYETPAKYRGELVHVEGWLRRLRWIDTTEDLAKDNISLYEGWIFEPAFYPNPTCVVVSELPPGLSPSEDMKVWVSFDGYFFKRYKYKTTEKDEHGQFVWRGAPLSIGRSLVTKSAPVGSDSSSVLQSYSVWLIPLGLVLVVLMIGTVLLLGKFFRRGDQLVHARVASIKQANPFDESAPQLPPGELPVNRLPGDPSEN
ncbi:MAG TPA: hypothetical protein VKS79_14765 [Gemmataceae bacterium]|nr:hypothetical protein [Gemmataceae bacterium]